MNLKKNISQYIPYVCILFFSTLIIFFGNNDIEVIQPDCLQAKYIVATFQITFYFLRLLWTW